jgi:hypothetical protein
MFPTKEELIKMRKELQERQNVLGQEATNLAVIRKQISDKLQAITLWLGLEDESD